MEDYISIEKRKKYVGYFRVSSQKQGESGLGLEAQKQAVLAFVRDNELLNEFVEIETGTKKKDRPQLRAALQLCKKENAILVIAKLDRLSRNVAFIANLLEMDVEFIALDMPVANRLTVHILAAVAEHEASIISSRTSSALHVLKRNGAKLGNPENLDEKARKLGPIANRNIALNHSANISATALAKILRYEKGMPLQKVADELNSAKLFTRNGKYQTACSIRNLLNRAELIE
jgi:DNA invertase Pin-like site-specific DNA recombinase